MATLATEFERFLEDLRAGARLSDRAIQACYRVSAATAKVWRRNARHALALAWKREGREFQHFHATSYEDGLETLNHLNRTGLGIARQKQAFVEKLPASSPLEKMLRQMELDTAKDAVRVYERALAQS